jgi:four helix bundle protein
VDIPAFIADGCGRDTNDEFRKAINMSFSLSNRLEYFALVAHDLEMLSIEIHGKYVEKIVEVRKMLSGFNKKLER